MATVEEVRALALSLPRTSDLRYQWVVCRIGLLGHDEMTQRVTDAWAMCVPAFLVRERLSALRGEE